ncbi:MAG: YtxH domain-containing protein [Chloroflexi bacterium]|nr:YtxH domain-containing protein [Chloroflexota bacterium]
MSSKDTLVGVAIGLLAGAAVGAAIGILYAPRPGAETRDILVEKAQTVKERAAELARKAMRKEEAEVV